MGTDFFPTADAGLMKLHFRAPTGTRIEETERLGRRASRTTSADHPEERAATINDNIGVPSPTTWRSCRPTTSAAWTPTSWSRLTEKHDPTARYMREAAGDAARGASRAARSTSSRRTSSTRCSTSGCPRPIDIQIEHAGLLQDATPSRGALRDAIATVPGAADVHILQVVDYPALQVEVDRVRAAQLGVTQRDVANSVLVSLSSSCTVAPSYFLNPLNNVNYFVAVKSPLRLLDSVPSLLRIPLTRRRAPRLPADARAHAERAGTDGSGSWTVAPPADRPAAGPGAGAGQRRGGPPAGDPQLASATTRCSGCWTSAPASDGRDLGSVVTDIQRKIDGLASCPAAWRSPCAARTRA